jgi:undecaprenyl-phosphate 4-deoxy-4-formamido-L-arabinose transferase
LTPVIDTPTLSIVVPVYNGALTAGALVTELTRVLPALTPAYEIILVNDGSRDNSWGVLTQLAQDHAHVKSLNLMRNYGQHNALLCGIRAARNAVIVTMDDDLQHPPEEIAKLLARLQEGFDVVYGTPKREQHGLWRDLASQLAKLALQNAMGVETARQVGAFRAFRTEVRKGFDNYQSSFVSIDVLLTWGTTRFAAVPVRHDERRAGVSNYTFRKLVAHAVNMMTGFTVLPLRLASFIGFGFTLFGLAILAYVLIRYAVQGGSVPGFSFIASTIAVFSGAQLFALGIIGEYLARMHYRIMDKPAYVVRQALEQPPSYRVEAERETLQVGAPD